MNPVFEIIPEAIFFHETNLICEISKGSFSYVFENDVDRKFHGLSVFYFDNDKDIPGRLKEIFNEQPLLHKTYKKIFISYSGEESALLPEELYKPGENELLLDTLYGDQHESAVTTDLVADKKIYNVYRMPAEIHKVLVEQFPIAAFSHHHSLLIKQDFPGTDLLKVIFFRESFIAILIKGGELQVIQTYQYKSGTDVVYHLLNICRQFKMENIPLQTGGMIDVDSDLQKELHHYFQQITFDKPPAEYEFTDSLQALPPHYFSHLYSLALCV
ncbi:MAG TPA: DUF3822 family protein [Chitinophagaceae bacterium]|nr:DUF3822 family protein [Chitinophagaceae bacterium]